MERLDLPWPGLCGYGGPAVHPGSGGRSMRNLLALIGLVVVGFAAIGWYCGWYQLTVLKGTDGKPEIRTTVNTDKVTEDSSAFFQRMEQLVNQKVKPDD